MTMHAYQEYDLPGMQSRLGDLFDYGVNVCGINGSELLDMFIVSKTSKQIEYGAIFYYLGKSGIEMLIDVIYETSNHMIEIEVESRYFRSKEYWIGWILAYYQWYYDRPFSSLLELMTYDELDSLYKIYHEMDVSKFTDLVDSLIRAQAYQTCLKKYRKNHHLTQQELAKKAGVSLRSIQMYEQKQKDINKASAETLYKLSKALGCQMEDLLERK